MDKSISDQLAQFMAFIAERFSGIEDRFSAIDRRLEEIGAKIDRLQETKADRSDIDRIFNILDEHTAKLRTHWQEHVMLAGKADRHEKWHQKIAKKLGIKLDY